MKKIIKTGVEIGVLFGVARMTYAAIMAGNLALCRIFEKKVTQWTEEFKAASDIYKAKHPEMFNEEEDEEEDEDADE